jgi:hypothetical protein
VLVADISNAGATRCVSLFPVIPDRAPSVAFEPGIDLSDSEQPKQVTTWSEGRHGCIRNTEAAKLTATIRQRVGHPRAEPIDNWKLDA